MKKGFTLMELLVVILIVAVIGVASTISFSGIKEDTAKSELENKYIEIQRAANLYADLHQDALDNLTEKKSVRINISALKEENYISQDLSNPVTGGDISSGYSVILYITKDGYVDSCILNITYNNGEKRECIANSKGKKENCCSR